MKKNNNTWMMVNFWQGLRMPDRVGWGVYRL
jgi:hypothetical protein